MQGVVCRYNTPHLGFQSSSKGRNLPAASARVGADEGAQLYHVAPLQPRTIARAQVSSGWGFAS